MDQERRGRTQRWPDCNYPGARNGPERTNVLAIYVTTGLWLDEHRTKNYDLPDHRSCPSDLVDGHALRPNGCSFRLVRSTGNQYADWRSSYASAFAPARDDTVVFAGRRSPVGSRGRSGCASTRADHRPDVTVNDVGSSVRRVSRRTGGCSFFCASAKESFSHV